MPIDELTSYDDRLAAAEARIHDLEQALMSSRRIGAALGIVMSSGHFGYDEAWDRVCRLSQDRQVKVRALAELIIEAGGLPA